MDILQAPSGEKVFDPEDAGTDGVFNTGKAKNAEEYFNVGKTISDQFTTSSYEQIRNEVKNFVDDAVSKQQLDPTQAVETYRSLLAQRLEPLLDAPTIARAKNLTALISLMDWDLIR